MFDKLIEIITNWWLQLTPVIIVRDYEGAVLLRCGKFYSVLEPGLHFKIPFVQTVVKMDVQTQKYEAKASAASKDLQTVSVDLAVNYHLVPENVPSPADNDLPF